MTESPHKEPTVTFVPEMKLMDLYKMYADRVTAIRQIMLALLAVSTATVSMVIALRGSMTLPIFRGVCVFSGVVFVIALLLKIRIMALVRSYEKSVGLRTIYEYKLLPLDSLKGPLKNSEKGEAIYFASYSSVIFASFAAIMTAALLYPIIRP